MTLVFNGLFGEKRGVVDGRFTYTDKVTAWDRDPFIGLLSKSLGGPGAILSGFDLEVSSQPKVFGDQYNH